jgi:hypothetical protein
MGPVKENARAVGSDADPSKCLCKTAAAVAKAKRSLKMTQLDPSGSNFGMRTKKSRSFPDDIVEIELVSFMWGFEFSVGAHNLLNNLARAG